MSARARSGTAGAPARPGDRRDQVESLEAKAEQAEAKVEQAVASTRENVLSVLAARGVPGTEDARSRVMRCDDLALLQCWLVRALSATSAEEIFSEPP